MACPPNPYYPYFKLFMDAFLHIFVACSIKICIWMININLYDISDRFFRVRPAAKEEGIEYISFIVGTRLYKALQKFIHTPYCIRMISYMVVEQQQAPVVA
jgi:hypothetical protein